MTLETLEPKREDASFVASFIIHDVVHVARVGNDGKWFVAHVNQEHVNQERLVAAYIVNVIDEAERLKNFQGMRSTAQPESVEADWPRPGRSLDALDTLLIGRALFFRSHGKLRGPSLPVSDLDLATIKDLEESRQTLFIAVVVPFARRQIWIFRIDLRHRAFGSAGWLCATLHLHRNGDNHANAVWPERAYGKFVLFTHRVCERDRRWHCACHGCEGPSFN